LKLGEILRRFHQPSLRDKNTETAQQPPSNQMSSPSNSTSMASLLQTRKSELCFLFKVKEIKETLTLDDLESILSSLSFCLYDLQESIQQQPDKKPS